MMTLNIPSLSSTLWRLLKANGFKHKNIYYLDETWYDTHDIVKMGWSDNADECNLKVPASRGRRLIIVHCGYQMIGLRKLLACLQKHEKLFLRFP